MYHKNLKCKLIILQSVKKRLLNNIFISDKEFIGIVLMGASTKDSANTASKNSTFFELSRPGADICRLLESYENKTGKIL